MLPLKVAVKPVPLLMVWLDRISQRVVELLFNPDTSSVVPPARLMTGELEFEPLPAKAKVPPLTIVFPLYLFVPDSVSVPASFLGMPIL